jgi:hypothetical protein
MYLLRVFCLARISILILALCPKAVGQIGIYLYSTSPLENGVIVAARLETNRILQSCGVSLAWSVCEQGDREGTGCEKSGPEILHLRLYHTVAAKRFGAAIDTFGFALSAPAPEFGVYVGVFHERVEEFAVRDQVHTGKLLGHVMAHEIGHLLLGGGGHAADGIMKSSWRGKDLYRMNRGELLCLPQQRKAMEKNVHARLAAARR